MQVSMKSTGDSRKRRMLKGVNTGFTYIVLILLAMIFVGPFFWLLSTALKALPELTAYPIRWWPAEPQWGNFWKALTLINYGQFAFNSLLLSTIFAVLTTLTSALVGFGFARLRGPGKHILLLVMLSTLMLPQILTVIPTYAIFARLQLVNTYWPWVLWGLASSPFLAFLFRQFFSSLPIALEEAAILDGCGYFRIFWQIFLPLSIPALVTSFLISFTGTWGDFVTPALFLSQDNTTLAVAMSSGYTDVQGNPLTQVMAAGSFLYVLPVLIVFFFAQRAFVRGIVTSGIK